MNSVLQYTSGFLRRLHRQPVLGRAVDVCKGLGIFRYRGNRGRGRQSRRQDILLAAHTQEPPQHNNKPIRLSPRESIDSILLLNARSMVNKLDELELTIQTHNPIAAVVTETWLHPGILDAQVNLPDYSVWRNDRQATRGGGVCAYVSTRWTAHPLKCATNHPKEIQCVCLLIRGPTMPRNTPSIVLYGTYIPPGLPFATKRLVTSHVVQTVDSLQIKYDNAKTLIRGDFNDVSHSTICQSLGLTQIVNKPTRENAILDLVLTDIGNLSTTLLPPLATSDHRIVRVDGLPTPKPSLLKRSSLIRIRPKPEWAVNECGRYLCNTDWSFVTDADSIDLKNTLLISFIEDVYNRFFPTKMIVTYPRSRPWMTKHILELIERRDTFYRAHDEINYRDYRLQVRGAIQKGKKNYYQSHVSQSRVDDPRNWHKEIKNLGRFGMKPRSRINFDLNSLNKTFTEMGKPPNHRNPNAFPSVLSAGPECILQEYHVSDMLKSIKTHKSQAAADIPAWLLQRFHVEFAKPVASIFNQSLEFGVIPREWATLEILPVPKVSHPNSEKDFRPITRLKLLPKVLEKFIASKLWLAINGQLDSRQYGGRKGLSVMHYLVGMCHYIFSTRDAGNKVAILAVDIAKAFNSTDREILYNEMLELNVPPWQINWVFAFFSITSQYVVSPTGDSNSGTLELRHGVPQGMALALPLFAIILNKMPPLISQWHFVDDMTQGESGSTTTLAIGNLQTRADLLLTKLDDVHLSVNPEKSNLLAFENKPMTNTGDTIVLNDHRIEAVTSARILGIIFQSNLKWDLHVKKMLSDVRPSVYFLRQLARTGITTKTLVIIYEIYVRTKLSFGCEIWAHSLTQQQKSSLELEQKRALRIITKDWASSYVDILEKCQLPTLSDHWKTTNLGFAWKLFCSPLFRPLFPPRGCEVSQRSSRSSNKLIAVRWNSEAMKKSPIPSLTKLLNESSLL